MPRGRPPKPTEEKRRLGNPGKRPLPAAGNLAVVPVSETHAYDLDPLEALQRVLDAGVTWLGQTDLPSIVLLRSLLEERAEVVEQVAVAPACRKDLRDIDKQIITMLAQLGFDPAARSRLGLAEVKAATKLETLRAQREARGK